MLINLRPTISNKRCRRVIEIFASCLAACAVCHVAVAADNVSDRSGHGHASVSYQYIRVDGFESSTGEIPIGTVDTHSLNIELDYYLSDKWTVALGLPFVRKRYNGTARHDPLALEPPRTEVENVDLGDWNNGFQDFHFGVRYLARAGRFNVEPYLFFGVPSNDYPFFGHAAVGQNLKKLDFGTQLSWFPGLSDAWYRLDLSYVFVEKTLGVDVSHWKVGAEAGYFFSRRLAGRAFAQLKNGAGLTFPDDFPQPRTTEKWYQHDRLVKHNYANIGIGLDWTINEDYYLSSALMTMFWAEQVHKMQYSLNVSLSRSF